MKIAVIADTHVPHKHPLLTDRLCSSLVGVELILHCGDIVEPYVLEELKRIAPVEAVAGNHDRERFGDALPHKKVVEVEGYRIGMIHGDLYNGNHVNKTQLYDLTYPVVVEPFLYEEKGVDVIVFGHGHKPFLNCQRVIFQSPNNPCTKLKHDVLVYNPGKPLRSRHLASVGFITLDESSIQIETKFFTFPRLANS